MTILDERVVCVGLGSVELGNAEQKSRTLSLGSSWRILCGVVFLDACSAVRRSSCMHPEAVRSSVVSDQANQPSISPGSGKTSRKDDLSIAIYCIGLIKLAPRYPAKAGCVAHPKK